MVAQGCHIPHLPVSPHFHTTYSKRLTVNAALEHLYQIPGIHCIGEEIYNTRSTVSRWFPGPRRANSMTLYENGERNRIFPARNTRDGIKQSSTYAKVGEQ